MNINNRLVIESVHNHFLDLNLNLYFYQMKYWMVNLIVLITEFKLIINLVSDTSKE